MANLITDPNNWKTGGLTPPTQWDGSKYVFTNQPTDMDLVDSVTVVDGDRVTFNANSLDGDSSIVVHYYDQDINDNIIVSQNLAAGDNAIDAELPVGGKYYIISIIIGSVGCNADTVTLTIAPPTPTYTSYNCDCDDDFPTSTLAELRQRMVVRLGYAALLVAPPGLVLLINDFLYQAQVLLYRKYSCFRTRRWFTWNIAEGQRFFDFGDNVDTCRKIMDPRKVVWVGISKGDNCWTELVCGINPVNYRSMQEAIPQFYEIRQCIEIWPASNSDEWQLRIKGDFGLLPFAADDDVTTIDAEAVFLLALANAKAHYEQPDAGTTMSMATGLIADLTAGQHFTRRYVPGVETMPNAIPPKMV